MQMPNFYRTVGPISGAPLNWQDEVSGVLPAAVKAYLDNRIDGKPLAEHQFEIVRAFMEYFIKAPCWDDNPHLDDEMRAELAGLRRDAETLRTPEEVGAWIHRCLDLGLDPL
jgi:hypothetical protein